MKNIRIIIVDDQTYVRNGIRMSVETCHQDFCVVGSVASGEEFFKLLKTVEADIVLLDVIMPGGMDGVEVARRLKTDYPELKILAVSAETSVPKLKEMLEAGIDGFIGKLTASDEEFADAICSIMQGGNHFGRDIAQIMYKVFVSKEKTAEVRDEFTEQEKRIINLCREGLPGKLIADRLSLSLSTVNNHKNSIFRKLGINSTAELVKYSLEKGIIRIES